MIRPRRPRETNEEARPRQREVLRTKKSTKSRSDVSQVAFGRRVGPIRAPRARWGASDPDGRVEGGRTFTFFQVSLRKASGDTSSPGFDIWAIFSPAGGCYGNGVGRARCLLVSCCLFGSSNQLPLDSFRLGLPSSPGNALIQRRGDQRRALFGSSERVLVASTEDPPLLPVAPTAASRVRERRRAAQATRVYF